MTPKVEERSVVSSGKWIIGGSLLSPMRSKIKTFLYKLLTFGKLFLLPFFCRPSPSSNGVFSNNSSRDDDLFKTPEFLKQRPHKSLLHTPSPLCPQQPYTSTNVFYCNIKKQ